MQLQAACTQRGPVRQHGRPPPPPRSLQAPVLFLHARSCSGQTGGPSLPLQLVLPALAAEAA